MPTITQSDIDTLKASGQFDAEWYLATYKDVAIMGMDPAEHYLKFGFRMDRDPSPRFSTVFFRSAITGIKEWQEPIAMLQKRLQDTEKGPAINPKSVLVAAYRESQFGSHARALELADQYLPDDFRHTLHILKANAAIARKDEAEWLFNLNSYLAKFKASPISLTQDSGPLLDRFNSAPLPQVTGGPMVSVIMPAWNAKKTVRAAARSILNQTWRNLELLIVDDCSEDGTWAVLQEIAASDPRVRIRRNKVNVGPYVSKNFALQEAKGDWITGHDADDWAHPQRLAQHLRDVLSMAQPARASLTYMVRMQPLGHFSHIGKKSGFSIDGAARLASISCLYQKDLISTTLGYWDSVRFGADSEMIARAEQAIGSELLNISRIGMICLDLETSLTNHSVMGVDKTHGISPIRAFYRNSWKAWLTAAADKSALYLPLIQNTRRYEAKDEMIVLAENIEKNMPAIMEQGERTYTASGVKDRWSLVGNRLVFHHPKLDVFWEMPSGFKMPEDRTLSLAEFLLLTPHGEQVEIAGGPPKAADGIAIAFSGGVDSAAATVLFPQAMPVYTQVAQEAGSHVIENALLAVKEVGGISIVSNYDILPLVYGKRRGFFGSGGFCVTIALLSDHFGFRTLCDGNVLETIYMHSPNGHGTKFSFRDLSASMNAFKAAGLNYCIPCAGLTEVSTTKIAKNIKFAMGCMRGNGGKPCGRCVKCYRKNALQGKPTHTNPEVETRLSKEIIPMLPSLLWARDVKGLDHPELRSIKKDISWVDKWFPDSIKYIPEELREGFVQRLASLNVEKMTDTSALLSWCSDRNVTQNHRNEGRV